MKISKDKQIRLLLQCMFLFTKKKPCGIGTFSKWRKLVLFAHNNGYLYCRFDKNNNVSTACIAYRVVHVDRGPVDVMPEKEEGDTLYVSAVASSADDKLGLFRLMKWYLSENPFVNQIAYFMRNSNEDLRIHQLHKKEISHGQEIIR